MIRERYAEFKDHDFDIADYFEYQVALFFL